MRIPSGLNLFYPTEICSLWSDTMNLGWPSEHIKGSEAINSKMRCTSVPEAFFILANNTNPDEMPRSVAFHLGLHCLSKYPFRSFQ